MGGPVAATGRGDSADTKGRLAVPTILRHRHPSTFPGGDRGSAASTRVRWPQGVGPSTLRSVAEIATRVAGLERRRDMSAQAEYLQVDAIGVAPTLVLIVVMLLTALGVVAHAAFI